MKYAVVLGLAALAVAVPAPDGYAPPSETPCTLEICTNPAKEPTQYYQTTTSTKNENGWAKPTTTTSSSTTTKDEHGWGKSTTTTSSTTKDDKNGWGKKTTTTTSSTTKDEKNGWGKKTTAAATTTSSAKKNGWEKPYTVQSTVTKDGKVWVTPVVVTPAATPTEGWNKGGDNKPIAPYTGAGVANAPIAVQGALGGLLAFAAFLL